MADNPGRTEMAEPASQVGDGIVAALKAGDFHLWPDSLSKQIGGHFRHFAENVIEPPVGGVSDCEPIIVRSPSCFAREAQINIVLPRVDGQRQVAGV